MVTADSSFCCIKPYNAVIPLIMWLREKSLCSLGACSNPAVIRVIKTDWSGYEKSLANWNHWFATEVVCHVWQIIEIVNLMIWVNSKKELPSACSQLCCSIVFITFCRSTTFCLIIYSVLRAKKGKLIEKLLTFLICYILWWLLSYNSVTMFYWMKRNVFMIWCGLQICTKKRCAWCLLCKSFGNCLYR